MNGKNQSQSRQDSEELLVTSSTSSSNLVEARATTSTPSSSPTTTTRIAEPSPSATSSTPSSSSGKSLCQIVTSTGGVTDKPTFSSSVERLDPREGIWHNIPRLGRTSGACSSAVVANMVYCSGFRSGVTERFETRSNRWEEIADAPGLSGRLVATKGELYRVAEEGLYQYGVYDNTWNNILDVKCFSTEIVALAD